MSNDRLSALDVTFWHLEKGELPMHVGGLLVFEGPGPAYDALRHAIEIRLPLLSRYRQRVREVPLQLNTPVWVDDAHFDLDYHLRHVALPEPGDEQQLRALTSHLMSQRLDLARPLWEIWLIDGLAGGRWALLSKVHHAMIDGMSGRDLAEVLLSERRDAADPEPEAWRPVAEPDSAELVGAAVADTMVDPFRTAERLAASLAAPRDFAQQALARATGTLRVGGQLMHTEDYLIGKVGPYRRWTWVDVDLAALKTIKDALGGTVNDVLLSIIAGGLRALLLERGTELNASSTMRTMVPVSTRRPTDASGGNLVSAIFTDLPVGQADPAVRLRMLSKAMAALKRSPDVLSVPTMLAAAPFMPPMLIAAAGRLAVRVPQLAVSTITTNVPGPQHPLYFLGCELVGFIPFVPLGTNVRTAVAMMSYNGTVWCGITADYDAVPDVEQIAEGIHASLSDLEVAAGALHAD